MYTVQVSADGNAWMTATGCEDGFASKGEALEALADCQEADPSFQFRVRLTAFGLYWREVYGDKSASQVCSEYVLVLENLDDLRTWITRNEAEAARQGSFQHWEAIQAEWNALGFSTRAYELLEAAATAQAEAMVAHAEAQGSLTEVES
jgi:hypothetical protein